MPSQSSRKPRLSLPFKNKSAPSPLPAPPAPPISSKPPEFAPKQIAVAIRLINIFRERWPRAFPPDPRPLQIGIHIEIAARAPDFSSIEISNALAYYTSDPVYLSACVKHASRIDLDGRFIGWVTSKDAAHAARRLKKMTVR